ncbi:hypothetical protein GWK48_06315 [Metallosphaera tengchongensis]|uniref:Uncharacterized protein n=1 Tax=Metallosphaera tengchongensis TaxID=1532350 RepID=A0A6N0NTL8_9CREN|nr:hypothetical protein [Metallosphaera tengchongensis]QKR00042.1 hypothetical protein GWK48_06315 [Metallosphaera tengchongensis]
MKSPFGSIILALSGVFYFSLDIDKAREAFGRATKIYPDFKIYLLDLSKEEDKIIAVDIDPDLADLTEGYVIAIEA